MKYFLFADTMTLYAVPKKYWQLLDIINGGFGMGSDYDHKINEAATKITQVCKPKLIVHALTQIL